MAYSNGHKVWYAIQRDAEDNEWGNGTFVKRDAIAEARRLRRQYPDDYSDVRIAVIEDGPDPVCIDILYI